jgi:serine phosphatase RsbU (regulator of sigma subunit)
MLPAPTPIPPRSRRAGRLFTVWLAALVVIIADHYLTTVMKKIGGPTAIFGFLTFLAALVLIAVSMYGFALIARWTLRKLFWRVGRRLFLSYVLIGIFPFFLFAILMLAIVYTGAGVMTHAAFRGERQASLGQLESAAQEYGLSGKTPAGMSHVEIYDTAAPSGAELPGWLKETTFSGIVSREDHAYLLASHQFPRDDLSPRTVVLVQPIDREWADQLEEKSGMTARPSLGKAHIGSKKKRGGMRVTTAQQDFDLDDDDDGDIPKLVVSSLGRSIIWGDVTDLNSWETGGSSDSHELFTLIINPVPNLFHFYGAGADNYVGYLMRVIGGITVMLMFMYMIATLFAGVLIFSITRAVNRIEKGTKAVERGDFSYRIAMKPTNQLGEMALSFDRMTASIASLLTNVAEKERLQSEIAIAATIQRNLLPKDGPKFRGVSFSAHFEPTASIGGDYYDVFNLDKSRLAVAIGDVSGHGLSTGLVMAMVKAAMTTLVEEGAEEVSLFHRLNELVFRSTERRAFMTLAFTIFDLERGTIRHTNAGHLYPYLLREGEPAIGIEVPSLPLGVRSEITTRTVEVDLHDGDTIVYLSDGIVEAQDENGEPFGFEALELLLARADDRSPNAIRDTILHAVARHAGTRPADDDRTVMVLRFENFSTALQESLPALGEPVAVTT